MIAQSGIYVGRVVHSRMRPKSHRLSYACYWLLVDLDELPSLGDRLRVFSYNRFNLFSLRDADHGAGASENLRSQIDRQLRNAGVDIEGGKILLLTMPRILGYAFNPISVYYCYTRDERLAAIVYEVHNTFRQRHSYLIAVEGDAPKEIAQHCEKRFYVSPFLEMDLAYAFKLVEPATDVRLSVRASDTAGLLLAASLAGKRRALSDGNLLKVFLSHPILPMKVIAAIHWEALKLWLKGIALVPRPLPPASPVTIGRAAAKVGE